MRTFDAVFVLVELPMLGAGLFMVAPEFGRRAFPLPHHDRMVAVVILLFTVMDPEAPASCKFAAANLPDGASVPNFFCSGESPQAARDKMQAFLTPPKKVADIKQAVIVPGEPEPVSVAEDDEVL